MTRRLEVEFVNRSCALVRGFGSRELVVELRGRPPVRSIRERAWVLQPSTAADLIALAESRCFEVYVLGAPPLDVALDILAPATTTSETPDPGRGLW